MTKQQPDEAKELLNRRVEARLESFKTQTHKQLDQLSIITKQQSDEAKELVNRRMEERLTSGGMIQQYRWLSCSDVEAVINDQRKRIEKVAGDHRFK